MLKYYRLFSLMLASSLLLACLHDPITNQSFKKPEPTAVRTKNGNWVAVIPNCHHQKCCKRWVCRKQSTDCEAFSTCNPQATCSQPRSSCGSPACKDDDDMTIETNYFGCATARNLGMMISNPKDLVSPEKTRAYIVHNGSTQSSLGGNQGGAAQGISAVPVAAAGGY